MLPAALIAARLEGVPTIVHAAELLSGDPTRRLAARVGGWLLARFNERWAGGIAACSHAVAAEYAYYRNPLELTYPAIAEPRPGDSQELRAHLGVPPSAPLVVALGSVSERRGQDVLVRAMHAVRRALPDAHCAIFGDPFPRASDLAFHQDLTELVIDPRLDDSVRLMPATSDVGAVLAAADVVVNPARVAESFGRVACEALLAGTPVVSSDVGAVREVLRDGETGILVPPGRPAALASAILDLLRDPDLSRELCDRGQEDVRARFGADTGLEEFERLVAAVR
jgi:glycosyltransferase involved in cell wall biosynthesis